MRSGLSKTRSNTWFYLIWFWNRNERIITYKTAFYFLWLKLTTLLLFLLLIKAISSSIRVIHLFLLVVFRLFSFYFSYNYSSREMLVCFSCYMYRATTTTSYKTMATTFEKSLLCLNKNVFFFIFLIFWFSFGYWIGSFGWLAFYFFHRRNIVVFLFHIA